MTNQHLMKKYTKGKLWKNVGVLSLICQKSKSTYPDSKILNVLADENFLYRLLLLSKHGVDISYFVRTDINEFNNLVKYQFVSKIS